MLRRRASAAARRRCRGSDDGQPQSRFGLETTGSLRFLEDPDAHAPRSSTPVRPARLAISTCEVLPSAIFTTSALTVSHFSELNDAARVLPVYASQPRSPSDHATLGSGWSLAFAGRMLRWVPLKVSLHLIGSSFSRLCLTHKDSFQCPTFLSCVRALEGIFRVGRARRRQPSPIAHPVCGPVQSGAKPFAARAVVISPKTPR